MNIAMRICPSTGIILPEDVMGTDWTDLYLTLNGRHEVWPEDLGGALQQLFGDGENYLEHSFSRHFLKAELRARRQTSSRPPRRIGSPQSRLHPPNRVEPNRRNPLLIPRKIGAMNQGCFGTFFPGVRRRMGRSESGSGGSRMTVLFSPCAFC